MKPRAPNRAKLHLFFAVILFLATLSLLIIPRSQNVCTALKSAHKKLLHAIHDLPHNTSRLDIQSAKPLHDHFRKSSTAFLAIASLPQARHCRPLHPRRAKLEVPLLRSTAEPVLLYLLSVAGARKKIIVSLDSASGVGHLAGGIQALLHGWRVIAICQKWTGFEATRKFYDGMSADVSVIDASSSDVRKRIPSNRATPLDVLVTREGVGGVIDTLILFPEHGEEVSMLRRIRESTLRPRIIAVFFQAYWGTASRVRTGEGMSDSDGRERLFVGASLSALVALAERVQYRLVWCMASTPIAFFLDDRAGVASGLLRNIRVKECMQKGLKWRRDAEAMWDIAQDYKWETVT